MKSQLKRFSKSTLAVILSLCMLVSCMMAGIIAIDAAYDQSEKLSADTSRTFFIGIPSSWGNKTNWTFGLYSSSSSTTAVASVSGSSATLVDSNHSYWDINFDIYAVNISNTTAAYCDISRDGNLYCNEGKNRETIGSNNFCRFGWQWTAMFTYMLTDSISISKSPSGNHYVNDSITLTANQTYSTYNAIDSTAYTVKWDNASGSECNSGTDYTLNSGVFTPKKQGKFYIVISCDYHNKGFADLSGTASANITLSVTGYYVASSDSNTNGNPAFSSTAWGPSDPDALMTETATSNVYSITFNNITAGTYYYKVTHGTWTTSYPSQNASITVPHTGDSVTITYNSSNNAVSGTVVHPSYTVTLNTNGGTINSGNVTSYQCGTGATLPTDVTKAKATFNGWFTANSGGTQVTSIGTSETGNKTFYAHWTEQLDPPAQLTLNGDPGNCSVEATTVGEKIRFAWVAVTNAGSYKIYKGNTMVAENVTNCYYDIERGASYSGDYSVVAVPDASHASSYAESVKSTALTLTVTKKKLSSPTVTVSTTDIKAGDSFTLSINDPNTACTAGQYNYYYYTGSSATISNEYKVTPGTPVTITPDSTATYKVIAYPLNGSSNDYYTQSDAGISSQVNVYSPKCKVAGSLVGTGWDYASGLEFTEYDGNGVFHITTESKSYGTYHFKFYDSSNNGYSGSTDTNNDTAVVLETEYTLRSNSAKAFEVTGSGVFIIHYDTDNEKIWVTQTTWTIIPDVYYQSYNLATDQYNSAQQGTTGGTISPSGATLVNKNSSITLTATPKSGYYFDGWYTDPDFASGHKINGAGATYTFTPSASGNYYALFKKDMPAHYTVSVAVNNTSYATVSATYNGRTISTSGNGTLSVPVGASVSYTITPATGCQIDSKSPAALITSNSGSFTMPGSNTAISVVASKINYTLTPAISPNYGTLKFYSDSACTNEITTRQYNQTFYALYSSPSGDRYALNNFSISGTGTSNTATTGNKGTFNMGTANAIITANLKAATPVFNGSWGTMEVIANQSFTYAPPNTSITPSGCAVTYSLDGGAAQSSNTFVAPATTGNHTLIITASNKPDGIGTAAFTTKNVTIKVKYDEKEIFYYVDMHDNTITGDISLALVTDDTGTKVEKNTAGAYCQTTLEKQGDSNVYMGSIGTPTIHAPGSSSYYPMYIRISYTNEDNVSYTKVKQLSSTYVSKLATTHNEVWIEAINESFQKLDVKYMSRKEPDVPGGSMDGYTISTDLSFGITYDDVTYSYKAYKNSPSGTTYKVKIPIKKGDYTISGENGLSFSYSGTAEFYSDYVMTFTYNGSTAIFSDISPVLRRIYLEKPYSWQNDHPEWTNIAIYHWGSYDNIGWDNAIQMDNLGYDNTTSEGKHYYYLDIPKTITKSVIENDEQTDTEIKVSNIIFKGWNGSSTAQTLDIVDIPDSANYFALSKSGNDYVGKSLETNAVIPNYTRYVSEVKLNLNEKTTVNIAPTYTGAEVTYSSSEESVVTVDSDGIIHPRSSGSSIVTVTVKGTIGKKLAHNISHGGDCLTYPVSITVNDPGKFKDFYIMSLESAEYTVNVPKVNTDQPGYFDMTGAVMTVTGIKGVASSTKSAIVKIPDLTDPDPDETVFVDGTYYPTTFTVKYAIPMASNGFNGYSGITLSGTVATKSIRKTGGSRYGISNTTPWKSYLNDDDTTGTNVTAAVSKTITDAVETAVSKNIVFNSTYDRYSAIFEEYQYVDVTFVYDYFEYKPEVESGMINYPYDAEYAGTEDRTDAEFNRDTHTQKTYTVCDYEVRAVTASTISPDEDLVNAAMNALGVGPDNNYYDYQITTATLDIKSTNPSAHTATVNVHMTHSVKTYSVFVNGTRFERQSNVEGDTRTKFYYQEYAEPSVNVDSKWYAVDNKPETPEAAAAEPVDNAPLLATGKNYKFRVKGDTYLKTVAGEYSGDFNRSEVDFSHYETEHRGNTPQTLKEYLLQNFYIADFFSPEKVLDYNRPNSTNTGYLPYDEAQFVGGGVVYYSMKNNEPFANAVSAGYVDGATKTINADEIKTMLKSKIEANYSEDVAGEVGEEDAMKAAYGTEISATKNVEGGFNTGIIYRYLPLNQYKRDGSGNLETDGEGKYTLAYDVNNNTFRYSNSLQSYQYVYASGNENKETNKGRNMRLYSYYVYSYVTYDQETNVPVTKYEIVLSDNYSDASTYWEGPQNPDPSN